MRYFRIAFWGILMCVTFIWQYHLPEPSYMAVNGRIIKDFIPDIVEEAEVIEPEEEPVLEPEILEQYRELYETNNDMIGFLYLTEEYQYPVLQRIEDQNYYAYRNFLGEEDKEGCIFANRYTELGKSGVSMLYGHTLKSGRMFASLKKYQDADYFEEHRIIKLDTLYEELQYEVMAVALTSLHEDFKYFEYVGNLSEAGFDEWKSGLTPYIVRGTVEGLEYGDVICELTCCAYHTKDGRLVVILKAI